MNEFEREYKSKMRREQFRQALAILWAGPPDVDSPPTKINNRPVVNVDNLTGLELLYHYVKSFNGDVIGSPTTAFAVFHSDDGNLDVFTEHTQLVNVEAAPWGKMRECILEAARNCGAKFSPCEGEILCEMMGARARGQDYVEAAMRAWLVYQELGFQQVT